MRVLLSSAAAVVMMSAEPSRLPSSTRMISYVFGIAAQAACVRCNSSGRLAASLYTGMTMDTVSSGRESAIVLYQNVCQRYYDAIHISRRHVRKQRQTQQPLRVPFGVGQMQSREVSAVMLLFMHGTEMDARANAFVPQRPHAGITIDATGLRVDTHDEQMPGVDMVIRRKLQRRYWQWRQLPQITLREAGAAGIDCRQALELFHRDGCVNVCQVVFVT